jgi:TP901 family phage tail tape measure protein
VDAGTVVIRLIADAKGVAAGFAQATGATRGYASQVAAMGAGAARVGKGMMKWVTLPVLAAGAASVKLALDFDKAMTDLEAMVGMSADEVARFKEEILDLAPAVGKTPQELGEAFYFIASSGLEGAAAMRALKASAIASAAGLGDTKVVADAVTSAINAYGESALSATKATDILVAAVREGKSEPEEFSSSIGAVIPLASKMGVEFGEVSGIMAAMSLNGTNAAKAVTQISSMLSAAIKPSEAGAKVLKSIGMSYGDLRKEIADKGLMPTVTRLDKAFKGNVETLGELFPNIRALRGFLALTGPEAEKYAGIIDRVSKAQGDAARGAEIALAKPGARLAKAWAGIQANLIKVGDIMLPVFADIADSVTGLTRSFDGLSDSTKQWVVKFALAAAATGPILILFSKIVALGGAVAGVISAVAPMAGALSAAFSVGGIGALAAAVAAALGPVGLVVAGVAAIGAAFVIAYQKSAMFRSVVTGALGAVKTVVGTVISGVSAALGVVGSAFSAVWDQVTAGARYVATTLGPPLEEIRAALSDKIGSAFFDLSIKVGQVVDILRAFGASIALFLTPVWAQIGDTVRMAFGIAQSYAKIGVDAVGAILSSIAVGIGGDWDAAWVGVKAAVHDAMTSIGIETRFAKATLGPMMRELGKMAAKAWEASKPLMKAAAKFVLAELWDAVKWAAPKVAKAVVDLARKMSSEFRQRAPGLLKAAGQLAMKALWAVIKSVASSIASYMASLPGKLAAGLKSLAGKLTDKGRSGMAGLLKGLREKWSDVTAFVSSVPGKITAFFSDAADWLYSAGSDIFNGLINGMEEAGRRAAEIASGIASDIKGAVTGFFGIHSPSTVMMAVGKDIALGLAHGLKKGQKEAISAASEVASNIASVLASALSIGDSITALQGGGMPSVAVAKEYAKKVAALLRAMSNAMKAELKKIGLGDAVKDRFSAASEMAGSMASIFTAFVELSPESVAKAMAGIAAAKTQARTIAAAMVSMVKDFRAEMGKLFISELEADNSGRGAGIAGDIASTITAFSALTAAGIDKAVAGLNYATAKTPELAAAMKTMVTSLQESLVGVTADEDFVAFVGNVGSVSSSIVGIINDMTAMTSEAVQNAIYGARWVSIKSKDLGRALDEMVAWLAQALQGIDADSLSALQTALAVLSEIAAQIAAIVENLAGMTDEKVAAAAAAGASLGQGFFTGLMSWHERIVNEAKAIAAETAAVLAGVGTPAASTLSAALATSAAGGGATSVANHYAVDLRIDNVQATSPEQAGAAATYIAKDVIVKLAEARRSTTRSTP